MTQKELSFYSLLQKVEDKRISQMKASELLQISDRHFRRLLKAYRKEGPSALISKKRGKPSNNKLPEKLYLKTISLIEKHYEGFGPTLAHEKLVEKYQITISVETLRQWMIKAGLWNKRKRKKLVLHQSRLRRANLGELIQVDGSPHDWFEGRASKCCLIGFIDDATSRIMHLEFVDSESTKSYFETMTSYLKKHGKPLSFYTDRLNVFRINPNKESFRKYGLTQIGRALKELEIELICANSPQAKGRIERLFLTLQDRLVKELTLENINTIDEANQYLASYIEKHNKKFAIEPKEKENMHRKIANEEIYQAMKYKDQRILSKNLELNYCNRILQVKTDRPIYTMKKAKVTVIESLDRKIEIEYQNKKLAFKELLVKDSQGQILNKKEVFAHVFPLGGKDIINI